MTLSFPGLVLEPALIKGQRVLSLSTGFAADSLEARRLVRASRGTGWLAGPAGLSAWTGRGVHQTASGLAIWGEGAQVPEGRTPEAWPLHGPEGQDFVTALVRAWTLRSAQAPALPAFDPAAVVPLQGPGGWSFLFLPDELRSVLASLLPLDRSLAWAALRHPEARGLASWAFASAALVLHVTEGNLPWAQDDEPHQNQELRDLKRTFHADELPPALAPALQHLLLESLTLRVGPGAAARWGTWAAGPEAWAVLLPDAARLARAEAARARRRGRRDRGAFWRRRGTVLSAWGLGAGVVVLAVGSILWGQLQPDVTDTWTPRQVVEGYYEALDGLDADRLRKLVTGTPGTLGRDQDEVSNLYVIRQVRVAYERQSPILAARDWEAAGRPALEAGKLLYGVSGLVVTGEGQTWTARYRRWVSEGGEQPLVALGEDRTDRLSLISTDRGWKIAGLERERVPLR